MGNHIANKIKAEEKSLSKILNDERFKIDVFQREYRWQRKHIEELISDLAISFLSSYKVGDGLDKYDSYDNYYMGPIVLCENNGSLSIVDGQQRLTSFTLLLLYLNDMQKSLDVGKDIQKDLAKYLYVTKGGKKSLCLDIDTREEIMEHLYNNPSIAFEGDVDDESVRNIIDRYENITRLFPEDIKNAKVLPIFIEWLIFKIIFVEVRAFSMENAYTIFETMNNRGMNLSPAEMLKGYLLSKVEDEDRSFELNELWKTRIRSIRALAGSESDLDFFRAWLRAKFADTIRRTKLGAVNEDFEIIGTQFHSWVSKNLDKIGLETKEDFYLFVLSDFEFYSTLFEKILTLQNSQVKGAEGIYISSFYKIADSLSFPLFMSSITKLDEEEEQLEKIKLISRFIDNYTTLRTLKGKSITQSSIRNAMYELIKSIRNSDIISVKEQLSIEIEKNFYGSYDFLPIFQVMNNWGYYHYFYARINYYYMQQDIIELPDFSEMMRSRKRNSLVLYRFINEGEPDNGVEPQLWENYINSIFSFCLVRRHELDNLYEMTQCDRIKYLIESNYMPEMYGMDTSRIKENFITEFIASRGATISAMIREVWSF